MLVSGAALLLACSAFIGYDLVTFRRGTVYNLSIQAQIAGSNAVSALLFDDSISAENTLSALQASPSIISAGILTLDGHPFAAYSRDHNTQVPALPPIPAGQTETYRFAGGEVLLVRSIVFKGKPTGIIYLQSDTQGLNARLRLYVEISGIVLAVSLLAALLISPIFRRAIAAPVAHLAEVAGTVSRDKNYSVRATPTGNHDEISVLIEAFNGMLSQIQERDAALQKAHDGLEQRVQERTAELAVSEERLRLMISGVKDHAILTLDPEGRVATWNDGAEHLKGYRAEEILGQHFSRFYPAEDIQSGKPPYELKVATEQGHFEDEGWRLRKDGSRFWATVVITALRDDRGQLRGFGKVTRDMTARKRADEEILLRTTQLEAANKELEAFSYSVSHDLRAPLRSIDGFSQALLEDYADKLDSVARDHLQRVRRAAQRMATLIDDMLNLSKVTRSAMHREKLNLSALANSIAAELREAEPGRQVEFVIENDLTAEGDSRLLRAALENLLGNSWKYTSGHPRARIEFGRTRQNGTSSFFVRDDGAGFNPRYAERLFGVFQRLHTATEFPGTGVGLATVQRIIRRHGGEIWAEGAVEKGATFYFTL